MKVTIKSLNNVQRDKATKQQFSLDVNMKISHQCPKKERNQTTILSLSLSLCEG